MRGKLAALTWALACIGAAPAAEPGGAQAVCSLWPAVLDVGERPGPLVGRIEIPGRQGGDVARLTGVHVASVHGIPLPGPLQGGEGIDAASGSPRVEDAWAAATGARVPNGRREQVVRFDRPCDGHPATRDDGDAGDLLAMVLDVPDGAAVEVCLAGEVDGEPFRCCDVLTVRNRGLRDLPGRRAP